VSRISIRRWSLVAIAGTAVAAAGCGGDDDGSDAAATATPKAVSDVKGRVSVVAVWSGDEQRSFQAVLDGFTASHPGVTVKYTSGGDNTPTVLSTAVEGGNPPDVASVAQPGLIRQFEQDDALEPLDFAEADIKGNFPSDIAELGTIDGSLYSFVFKAANKSTVWFNVDTFRNAGVSAPGTWEDFLTAAKTLKASGTPAYSIGGADGWTLTDLFENIYLRQAGPEKYDQLTEHEIPWTDRSVKDALGAMADVFSDTDNIFGGTSGALGTDFATSVTNVFSDSPKASMVLEGDFVPGAASETTLKAGEGYDVFPFPTLGESANTVVGGGDSIVMFKDTPASRALVTYLASPEAAEIWAKRGGFSSANSKLSADAYPDDITRTTATAISGADTFRFDMSDLAPAAFGGTAGQGEWKALQDFLENPDDVDGAASKLEAAAARAYKKR
jgi:alpha-glucoside transport system substrate-binding protein